MSAWRGWKHLNENEKQEIRNTYPNLIYDDFVFLRNQNGWEMVDLAQAERELENTPIDENSAND